MTNQPIITTYNTSDIDVAVYISAHDMVKTRVGGAPLYVGVAYDDFGNKSRVLARISETEITEYVY